MVDAFKAEENALKTLTLLLLVTLGPQIDPVKVPNSISFKEFFLRACHFRSVCDPQLSWGFAGRPTDVTLSR